MSIGITFGAWDLLHAGHVHFLTTVADNCDFLIIGLHVDPSVERPDSKEKPVQSLFERYFQLSNLELCDGEFSIVPYETEADLKNMLAIFDVDYYYLGSDYLNKQLPDDVMRILDEKNITIEYIPRLHTFSSTDLRKRIRAKK